MSDGRASRVPPGDESHCTSFPPLVARGCKVLVLGSMPGVISLRAQRYYANDQNLFWRVMGELVGATRELPYDKRVAKLTKAGVGVWDTLAHCERGGSLDSAIVKDSEVPNDFASLLRDYPTIRTIVFNGGKSTQVFKKRVIPTLAPELVAALTFLQMPSTSPANASVPVGTKLARWRELLDYLD